MSPARKSIRQPKTLFDILYECSGATQALASGIAVMRPRGTIVQLGLGRDMPVPIMHITSKELHLVGSFRFHEEFEMAVGIMQSGRVQLKPLITHTMPLKDATKAFEVANDRDQAIKVSACIRLNPAIANSPLAFLQTAVQFKTEISRCHSLRRAIRCSPDM